MTFIIDYRELLDLVFLKDLFCHCEIGANLGCDKILRSHDLADLTSLVFLETEVTIGNDAHKTMVRTHNDWHTTDMILAHDLEHVAYRSIWCGCDRSIDHTILSTFHHAHLMSLSLNRHVLVNNTDTTLTSHSNSHSRFSHCIHSGRNDWDVESNIT